MIGYVTLGTNDIHRAAKFYDTLLGELGAKRFMESDRFIAWGSRPDGAALAVIKPFDGNAATVGNGVMVALRVEGPKALRPLSTKAGLSLTRAARSPSTLDITQSASSLTPHPDHPTLEPQRGCMMSFARGAGWTSPDPVETSGYGKLARAGKPGLPRPS